MENAQIQNVKNQLSSLLAELKEKRANPFKGTDLEALTDEIRAMRKTYGLSYKDIAAKLTALKVQTDTRQVADFCRSALRIEAKKGAKPKTESRGA